MAGGGGDITRLPEGCISHVISLTSTRDACRSAAVSTTFRSAADSDTVWDRFLPPDHDEILSRAVDPVVFSSKKELFFRLCGSLLIEGGKMSFALERSSGRKCFMLSARELSITWGDTPHYWKWNRIDGSRDSVPVFKLTKSGQATYSPGGKRNGKDPFPFGVERCRPLLFHGHVLKARRKHVPYVFSKSIKTMFPEVAELMNVCWLEIRGKIDCKLLSKKTTYAAYLIFKLAQGSRGLSFPHQEVSVMVGSHVSEREVCLQPDEAAALQRRSGRNRFMNWRRLVAFQPPAEGEETSGAARTPRSRDDGWMEMELGDFFNEDGDDGDVQMSLSEIKAGHWKNGLVIEGIELRPK